MDNVVPWVTVIASVAGVVGVFLVWQQLRLMRKDRLTDERRQTAALLPAISRLRFRLEDGWGCDIHDQQKNVPPEESLEQIAAAVESDQSLMTSLQVRFSDVGLEAVVLASMIEDDLKIMRHHLNSVRNSGSRSETWGDRWPRMVRTALDYWELLERLETALPEHARFIGVKSPELYRSEVAQEVQQSVETHMRQITDGGNVGDWPPTR